MSVCECKQKVSSQEFTRWVQYFKTVPVGDDAVQVVVSQVVAAIYNASDKKKQSGGAFDPTEFIVDYWKGYEERTETKLQVALNEFKANAMLHNSSIRRKKDPLNG